MSRNLILALMLLFIAYILSPFLTAVGIGAIFAVLFYPVMNRIHQGRFPDPIAAGFFTLAVTLLIFFPIITIATISINSGVDELQRVRQINITNGRAMSSDGVLDQMFATPPVQKILLEISKFTTLNPEQATRKLKQLTVELAGHIGETLTNFIAGIPNIIVMFSVFLFSLYYFLSDGLTFTRVLRRHSCFTAVETNRIFKTFSGLCNSVILASLISGSVQAAIAVLVCLIVGLQQLTTIFLMVFVSSFIPLVGTFPIMMSMAIYQFLCGHYNSGWTLAVSALVIASVDNLIRPQIIRGSTNLHPLLGCASALGGLQVFGIVGIFLGPVLCGSFLEVAGICSERITYKDKTT